MLLSKTKNEQTNKNKNHKLELFAPSSCTNSPLSFASHQEEKDALCYRTEGLENSSLKMKI